MTQQESPKPLISIVVPIFNVSQYIERCIRSIIFQTYSQIECILVDDCTPDNSIELAKRSLITYSGPILFRFIHHETNQGLSAARNSGTDISNGSYIYYLDSDDELEPNAITALSALATKYNHPDMVQGNTKCIGRTSQQQYYDLSSRNFPEFINDNAWIQRQLFHQSSNMRIPVNAWNKLVRRDFLLRNILSFEVGILHEDELWMFQIVKCIQSIAFTDYFSYIHYVTPGSITQSDKNRLNRIHSWLVIMTSIFSEENPKHVKLKQKRYLGTWLYSLSTVKSDEQMQFNKFASILRLALVNQSELNQLQRIFANCILLVPSSMYKTLLFKKILFRSFIRFIL